jgi:hypothetical protein
VNSAVTVTLKLTPKEFDTLRAALESEAQTRKDLGAAARAKKEFAVERDAREAEARIRFLLDKVMS